MLIYVLLFDFLLLSWKFKQLLLLLKIWSLLWIKVTKSTAVLYFSVWNTEQFTEKNCFWTFLIIFFNSLLLLRYDAGVSARMFKHVPRTSPNLLWPSHNFYFANIRGIFEEYSLKKFFSLIKVIFTISALHINFSRTSMNFRRIFGELQRTFIDFREKSLIVLEQPFFLVCTRCISNK